MSIRKWFKGAKTKAMIVLGGFAMLLGVGASVSVATAVKENEVVETKAKISNCTVYYTSDDSVPNIYYNAGSTYSSWPGRAMTLAFTNNVGEGQKVYKASVSGRPGVIVFNNLKWNGGTYQTVDIDSVPYSHTGYYSTGLNNGKINVGSWQVSTFTISYNANGGSGSMSSQTAYAGVKSISDGSNTVKSNGFTRTGYTFSGWNTKANGSGSSYSANDTFKQDGTTAVTLYAQWTANTYTITFHQNDGTGYTVTQSKTYGVTYTIPSLATLGMGASTGRCFLRWDTDEHGEGTAYSEGSTYTTNAALDLYMIQDWYKYEYSADGGSSWVAVDSLLETPTLGYIGELVTSSTHALTSGSSLTFRKYYGSGSHTNVSINAFSGNYGDGAIKFNYTGNVAVRVASNGNLDVHVDGYTDRQIFVNSTPYGLYFSGNTDGYTNVPVALYPGDVIRGGFNGGSYKARLTAGDGDFSGGDGENEVVCNAPGVFTIHLLSYDSGANFPNVSFDMDDSASATLFAQLFNDTISELCDGIVDEGAAVTTLSTPWGTQATYYGALTSAAQTAVKSGSSDSDVVACRSKYDYVCGKYGPNGQKISGITDFMGRNPAKPASAGVVPGAPSANQSPLTLTLWIVLGAGVLGLGAIGTAYFVSKKKKRHQA